VLYIFFFLLFPHFYFHHELVTNGSLPIYNLINAHYYNIKYSSGSKKVAQSTGTTHKAEVTSSNPPPLLCGHVNNNKKKSGPISSQSYLYHPRTKHIYLKFHIDSLNVIFFKDDEQKNTGACSSSHYLPIFLTTKSTCV
jgi:hypothetical protein